MRHCLWIGFLLGQLLAAQAPPPAAQQSASRPSRQASTTTPAAASPDYSKEAAIVERLATKVAFNSDGTGTQETIAVARVQTEAGVHSLAVLSFSYLSSSQSVEIDYVRVRKPDGSVVTTPDSNVLDMPAEVTRSAPMYSDIHEKHVTVKALGVGDVLEYMIRYRILKPQVPGQFWFEYTFAQDSIVRDYELQITVPADKYVKVVSPHYKPEVRQDGDKRVYLWKTAVLETKTQEPRRYGPSPDVQITTFRNWNEVGQWYNQIQAPQLVETPQIKAKAAELTKGLTSEDDKIRAIYDFVSTHFHYVSLSLGNGLYRPHPAEDVLENEYGDCKDKHTLLAVLLGAAGIEAWPALISSTRKIDPDVPSPGQFDHMITYVPRSGQPLWLDTTAEVAPMGLLLPVLRDKEALVIPKDKPAELIATPANPPFPAATTFAINGTLAPDGTFTGHVEESLRGDAEVLYRLGFRTVAPAQWKQLVQNIVSTQGFGGEVSNVQASSPDDMSKPFTFSYDYTRKDYSDWGDRQIIAPLPPLGIEGAATQQKAPLDPVFLGAPGQVHYTAKLQLPLAVVKVPGDVLETKPWANFQSQYKADGQTITVERVLKIKQSDVPLADWTQYQQFAKAVSDDWGAWIQLHNASSTTAGSTDKATTPEVSPEVQPQMRQAVEALQRNDLATAESLILQVLQKDPQAQNAHLMLGYIYGRRNDMPAAIEQFRKEQQLYPNNAETYRPLAAYYLYKKDYSLAEEQFRKWLQIDPTNYDAMLGLDQVLQRQKKYTDEVTLWESAYKLMPDRPEVAYSLGLAYVRAKQPDKALPLLEKGLATETRPIVFNDVAYVLADENVALDQAQQWAEKALQMLEAESLKTDSDEAALDNTRNLDATWDTLGWVYFHRGEYEKAEPYLHAAFALSQDSTDGDHLGQNLEKQGKKEQAAHAYSLAMASPDHADKSAIRERYVKLTGKQPGTFEISLPPGPQYKQDRITSKESPSPYHMDAREELSRIRTYKISGAPPAKGSATFAVVFSPGKIEEVQFVSGEEGLKPMTSAILASSMRAEFPNSDPTHISRRGILVCESSGCELTLLPSDSAHAEQ